jgi:hypothetical protein
MAAGTDDPLTPDEIRQILRECVTVVKPGEVLVVRVSPDCTPSQVREYQDSLNAVRAAGGITCEVLVLPAEELGVAEAGRRGGRAVSEYGDLAAAALHAEAETAREEIRASSYGQLSCPSCGKPAADIIGSGHCLVMIPACEPGRGAVLEAECRDGRRAECRTWDELQAAANISLTDEVTRQFDRDAFGTAAAQFTGLLSILEQP